ncbi:hypothetical protein ACSLOE_30665, partial [Escherichia coli]
SKLAITFSRPPGGSSFSANDRTPDVYFFANGVASMSSRTSSGDRVQVLAALMAIGEELRRLRLAVREQGARDDC